MSAVSQETGLGEGTLVEPGADEDLEVIESRRVRIVHFRGEDLEIRPLTVLQIVGFAPHARPLVAAVNQRFAGMELSKDAILDAVNLDLILGLIESHGPNVLAAVAVATGKSEEWIGGGLPDEFLELTVAVVAVNADFFVQRLLPMLARNVAALGGHVGQSGRGGPTSSNSSSSTATR